MHGCLVWIETGLGGRIVHIAAACRSGLMALPALTPELPPTCSCLCVRLFAFKMKSTG